MQKNRSLVRLPMLLVVLLLTGALYGGLIRLGWDLPVIQTQLAGLHGVLMVAGVFGTVIAVERAVALRTNSRSHLAYGAFLPPLFSAIGAALLLFVETIDIGKMLLVLNGLGLVVVYAVVIHRQPTVFTVVMGAGGYMLLIGNALWATDRPVYSMVYWWMGFLILTIVGERLELARVMRPSRLRQPTFCIAVAAFVVGVAVTCAEVDIGARLVGIGELALAAWLLRYDIARFTIRQTGLPRFIAACLLTGYAWLGIGGLLSLKYGAVIGGFHYDAVLHAVLLGFVFSMIFGHAPIIIPAVLKLRVPFKNSFYLHFALMHGALALRVIGDLSGHMGARQWGGLLNVVAVVVFLLNTVGAVRNGSQPPHDRSQDKSRV
ncbi:hypothetical protein [Aggregatilinea lenta]|uniref:hypothetical protein n=1 Tax=Aggregatilinea lenta TaxID=913108 RepID=UPI000E5A9AFE|nr:hypothetical protein [Aggregatilinea lenta]